MAIRTLPAGPSYEVPEEPIFFPDSKLAHNYCGGKGIELGAGAHNPFNLEGAINVAPFSDNPENSDYEDFLFFKKLQIEFCGRYALIDLVGEAKNVPLPDHSQQYILSSHVVEHIPDLIGAFLEWNRLLLPNGIVFMIFPKRDVVPADVEREITSLNHFIEDFVLERNACTHPDTSHRGHYHIFTLQSMLDLIEWCNRYLGLNWKIEEVEETDSKIGNGHTTVARYLGPVSQREVQLRVASLALFAQDEFEVSSTSNIISEQEFEALSAELHVIKSTLSWRILQQWWRFGRWLMPLQSRRRQVYAALCSLVFRPNSD